jgi:hypothetical protein
MLRIAKKTKLSPEAVIDKAIAYFGPKGYGLTIKEQSPTCAKFEGAGGNIEVTTCALEKGSTLEVVSTEWDAQAKGFLAKI